MPVRDSATGRKSALGITRLIRSTLPSTKVLVVSSQSNKKTIDAARDPGVFGCVIKPFQPVDLIDAIRAVSHDDPFFVVGDAY